MLKFQNILLVYPRIPSNTYWSFKYALKFLKKKSAFPSLSLLMIAALFSEEYNLKLIDMNVTSLKNSDLEWADAVFISAMMVQRESFEEVVSICHQLGKPVVAGGPHVTMSYQEIQGVDHFLLGEVEDIFCGFLQDFQNGCAKQIYSSPVRPDITDAKIPIFNLLDLKAYASMSIQYSRGCPFNCEFCDIWKVYGRHPRVKNASVIIAELNSLFQLGWRDSVFIVDDNFIGNKKRVKEELLPALTDWQKAHHFPFRFYTEASINLAEDISLMSGMRDAGFNAVFLGIETPSLEALHETGKIQNLKMDMLAAVRIIQQYGMEVMGGFILGFDSDTQDIFKRQIDFIQNAGIPKAMVGLLNALPGTDLYYRLKKEGRILSNPLTGHNTHSMTTNFVTKISTEQLKAGYQKVLSTLYDFNLKNYFSRCNKLLDNLGATSFFQRDIRLKEVFIFFKSIIMQPCTRYGAQYLKFILRNFFKNRQFFSEAMRMSIEGHHFYMITQETLKAQKVSSILEERYSYFAQKLTDCREKISINSQKTVQDLSQLWLRKKIHFDLIKQKINEIHVDFRGELMKQYYDLDARIKDLFQAYQRQLIR